MPDEPTWLHPDAIKEARAAREWYGARSAEAALAFMEELDAAVARIEEGRAVGHLTSLGRAATCSTDFRSSSFSARRPTASRFWLSHTGTGGPVIGLAGKRGWIQIPDQARRRYSSLFFRRTPAAALLNSSSGGRQEIRDGCADVLYRAPAPSKPEMRYWR